MGSSSLDTDKKNNGFQNNIQDRRSLAPSANLEDGVELCWGIWILCLLGCGLLNPEAWRQPVLTFLATFDRWLLTIGLWLPQKPFAQGLKLFL